MKASIQVKKNNLSQARRKIAQLERIPSIAPEWVQEATEDLETNYRENLATQGRGGQGPTLSPVTHHLYDLLGEPDGSGITNHLMARHEFTASGSIGRFGVRSGRATMIARVQDQGVAIEVTPKMRAWRAAHGVPLKASTRYVIIPPRYSWRHAVRDANKKAKRKLRISLRKFYV
jgi:hypothetical protein